MLPVFLASACDTAEYYLEQATTDGIPFWDTGAPGLAASANFLSQVSDPYNDIEPLDSSAAVIAAQGLLRLGTHLRRAGDSALGERYFQAGLTIARTIFHPPYLSTDERHQGLILHAVYHRPAGWDAIPPGMRIPCGESSQWGDYHALELALMIERLARGEPYASFFISEERC